MHKAVVEIRDISEAKLYCVHTICETFATSQEDLTNIIPYRAITGCDAVSDIAGHGKGSAWNAFCSNPDLLANLGKGDFHDESYSSYPRSSSAGCSIFLMRAAEIMHGWLCLSRQSTWSIATYLHVMRPSCTFNELITSQWCGYRQHVTFHFFHHSQRQWDGQRATGHLFPPWCHYPQCAEVIICGCTTWRNVVAKMQTCSAQNRASADPVTCMNNDRWRCCEEKMSHSFLFPVQN